MSNEHEELARTLKAIKLARAARECGIDAEHAGRMTDEQWRMLAAAAGTREPSERTRNVVVAILNAWQA